MRKIKIGDCFEGQIEPVLVVVGNNAYDEDAFLLTDTKSISHYMNSAYLSKLQPLPTLHLPIGNDPKKYGGAWFDMIRTSEKKEEYREINRYYEKRFGLYFVRKVGKQDCLWSDGRKSVPTILHLTNGYGHDKPQLWAHIESISIGRGNPEWGAPVDRDVFIIRLGDVFHTKNLKKP
jgi:hypothetical protein